MINGKRDHPSDLVRRMNNAYLCKFAQITTYVFDCHFNVFALYEEVSTSAVILESVLQMAV
jgi:hypothetical protein